MGTKVRWTNDMLAVLKRRYPEEGAESLAPVLGVTESAIRHKAMRLGIVYKYPGKAAHEARTFWTPEREEILRQRYPSEGPQQLAKEFKKSVHAVIVRASLFGLESGVRLGRISASLRERASVNMTYFDEWSPNMAWLLGFTWADGSIVKTRGQFQVRWGVTEEDRVLIDRIRAEIGSGHKIYLKKSGRYGEYVTRPSVYLNVASTTLARTLMNKYQIPPRKSFIDPRYPVVPDEYTGHFVRGYLDGDGSVGLYGTEGRVTLISGGFQFLVGMQEQICRLTGVKKNAVSKSGKTWQIRWTSRPDLQRLLSFIYPAGEYIFLARKRDLLTFIVNA